MNNYAQWAETAVSEKTIQVQRNLTRDVYHFPNGTGVMEDYYSPHNVFKDPSTTVVVFLTVKDNEVMQQLVKQYNGVIEHCYYTEDGYGTPEFKKMEDAFNFSMNEREKILANC